MLAVARTQDVDVQVAPMVNAVVHTSVTATAMRSGSRHRDRQPKGLGCDDHTGGRLAPGTNRDVVEPSSTHSPSASGNALAMTSARGVSGTRWRIGGRRWMRVGMRSGGDL